jgi:hypothetical protein
VRLRRSDSDGAPSRSIMFPCDRRAGPDDIARRVLDDADPWFAESAIEPLPVPEWMRGYAPPLRRMFGQSSDGPSAIGRNPRFLGGYVAHGW